MGLSNIKCGVTAKVSSGTNYPFGQSRENADMGKAIHRILKTDYLFSIYRRANGSPHYTHELPKTNYVEKHQF